MEKSLESGLKAMNINEEAAPKVPGTFEISGVGDLSDKKLVEEVKVRHCAFCLNTVPLKDVKLCGKCKRRAYCSKECQLNDWSAKAVEKSGKGGQVHKNWCGLECGEEDIDWEVGPVNGRGLGLIAKRFIPAKYRIMVDSIRSMAHPKVVDLLGEKGVLIGLPLEFRSSLDPDGPLREVPIVPLRIMRINHECNPNAGRYYDETFKELHQVKIVFAERDIQAGEEICVSYTFLKDNGELSTAESSRTKLETWGITCPNDCICRDQEMNKLFIQNNVLDSQIAVLNKSFASWDKRHALGLLRKVLANEAILGFGLMWRRRTLFIGFVIALKLKSLEDAQEFIQKVYEITCCITSPKSKEALKFGSYYDKVRSTSSSSLDTLMEISNDIKNVFRS